MTYILLCSLTTRREEIDREQEEAVQHQRAEIVVSGNFDIFSFIILKNTNKNN